MKISRTCDVDIPSFVGSDETEIFRLSWKGREEQRGGEVRTARRVEGR